MMQEHLDSDRLLALVRASPTAGEAAHLADCESCRSELALLAAAGRLGVSQVPPVQPERVSAAVKRRLEEPVVRSLRRRSALWVAGLAAAASVVLLLGRPTGAPFLAEGPGSVLHELDDLSASELEEVLQALPTSSEAMPLGEVVPLGDLSAGDLERVLRSMEE